MVQPLVSSQSASALQVASQTLKSSMKGPLYDVEQLDVQKWKRSWKNLVAQAARSSVTTCQSVLMPDFSDCSLVQVLPLSSLASTSRWPAEPDQLPASWKRAASQAPLATPVASM